MKSIFDKIVSLKLNNRNNNFSYTYNHCHNVAQYSKLLAKTVGFKGSKLKKIEHFSLLHDIGKIAIDPSILHKQSRLTNKEFEIIQKHPEIGMDMLFKAGSNYQFGQKIILYHHEYYDGSGYPEGLKKRSIPLEARIVSITDAFDAMTSNRPYRQALTVKEAIIELEKNAGNQFDPYLVEKFKFLIYKYLRVISQKVEGNQI